MNERNSSIDEKEVFEWYRRFSLGKVDLRFRPERNAFCKVDASAVDELEAKSLAYPKLYLKFLREVGEGRFKQDRVGREPLGNRNYFMGPEDMLEILSKASDEWRVYPDLIGEGELPFFDAGDMYYLVFAPADENDSSVWALNKFKKIADDFVQFLALLRDDITFYNDIGARLHS